jgi:hypothetical protein
MAMPGLVWDVSRTVIFKTPAGTPLMFTMDEILRRGVLDCITRKARQVCFRGLPPLAPFTRAAADLAGDVACPARRAM